MNGLSDQNDQQLLRDYAANLSEAAFAELIRRHVDLVHSAAMRMVHDAHQAEDVTQGVFVALAWNAGQLSDRQVLSPWLHRTAQNIASKAIRSDVRRRAREQEAAAMNELLSGEPDSGWEQIAPHLDAALGELSEQDREALMLRYFERKSGCGIAQTLGISEEAAQKRVTRAVERLRKFFAKRGVAVPASSLVVALSANAVQAAPVGLAAAISTSAMLGGTALLTTATKAIAMTALQKTFITATIAAAVGVGIYESHQAAIMRSQVQTLERQQATLTEQMGELKTENERLPKMIAEAKDAHALSQAPELLRLRGEVGVLRQQTNELGGVRKENIRLSQAVAESETNQVSPEDELIVRQNHAVDAMSALLQALKTYATNHNGQYPANLDQLVAPGDLKAPKLAGNLGPSDFEFGQGLGTDPQGNETILRLRVPIAKPGGGGVMVVGGINDAGVPHTSTWNVSP
jgi:RNA polymerase sigma factor (sigma-70 family)